MIARFASGHLGFSSGFNGLANLESFAGAIEGKSAYMFG